MLLHGTFRQSKVLAGERMPWLAVGPDPVVGECAFDLARLVRDRVEDLIASPSGAATTRRRVKRLAESLDVDQERLRGWTLFRAVESGVRALRVGRPRDARAVAGVRRLALGRLGGVSTLLSRIGVRRARVFTKGVTRHGAGIPGERSPGAVAGGQSAMGQGSTRGS